MKQYIMGVITRGALILFTIMFMERNSAPTGRYIALGNSQRHMIDTVTGEVWEGTGTSRDNKKSRWFKYSNAPVE